MPTYEYTCAKCGHAFEKVQSIKDSALTICPKDICPRKRWGKGKVKRAVGGGSGLLFKGSGFYITDYRSDSYKAAAKKDAAGGETKSAPKTDAKPAATGSSASAAPAASAPAPASAPPKKKE